MIVASLRATLTFACVRAAPTVSAVTPVAGVDADLAAGLRIDEPHLADIGQLLLTRVADLDGEHLVAREQLQQRPPPVEWATEVGDDDDDAALPCQARQPEHPRAE